MMHRRARRLLAVAALVPAVLVALAVTASAHPLGNFTVNQYSGLQVTTGGLRVDYVLDLAELPTVQATPGIDTDGNRTLSPDELARYAAAECARLADGLRATIDGRQVALTPAASGAVTGAGQAGLSTLRVSCTMAGTTESLRNGANVTYENRNFTDRVGWREITAVGDGTTLLASDVPERTSSARLTAYPQDLLTSPLDVRRATLRVRPGGPALDRSREVAGVPPGVLPRGIDGLTRRFSALVGRQHLTPGLGLLGLLLAVVLGSFHALAPGHGKTVMAAYLVGQQGTRRQAAWLGGVVTVTHTAGVLVLGLLLTLSTALASERLLPLLEVMSGLLLAAVGVSLLLRALRRRNAVRRRGLELLPSTQPVPVLAAATGGGARARAHDHAHDDAHDHDHDRPHDHADHDADSAGHDHGPGNELGHDHGLGHHVHALPDPNRPLGWRTLAAMGVAGGLVPSPSALVVLLGAAALGRAWFGVLLVVAYGAGLALTLTLAGLALLRASRFLDRPRWRSLRSRRTTAVLAAVPVVTAGVIVVVGLGLVSRGLFMVARLS